MISSIAAGGVAVVAGASGGIGNALASLIQESGQFNKIVGLHRASEPALDVEDEKSIERAATYVKTLGDVRLVIDATGFLHARASSRKKPGATSTRRTWRNHSPSTPSAPRS